MTAPRFVAHIIREQSKRPYAVIPYRVAYCGHGAHGIASLPTVELERSWACRRCMRMLGASVERMARAGMPR